MELTDDPLLSLVFAERMGATIVGLVAGVDIIWGLELLIGRLVGLVMVETGKVGARRSELRQYGSTGATY
jgi:hypothetical protein